MTTSLVVTTAVGIFCGSAGVILGLLYANSWAGDKAPKSVDADAQQMITSLRSDLERQKKLRAQERSGRTNAEREAREIVQQQLELNGYNFESIGHVQSCFPDRRGTPRQGTFFPLARGRIKFRTSIPPASLECVEQFSHLWVLFVFHENTNITKASNSTKSTYPAKIAPPRLGGQKVGLFSTRTPHRPNSIGLTVVKIEKVSGRCIEISGHDLVDGTPVLDVKPYLHADSISDFKTPHWVMDTSDAIPRPVHFSHEARESLEQLVHQQKLNFYTTIEEIQQAIEQMLVLDIRSVHQGRGHASDQQFCCHFDRLEIIFQTLQDSIQVVSCTLH